MTVQMQQIMQTNPDPMGWPTPTGFFECSACGAFTGPNGAGKHIEWHERNGA